MKKEIKSQTEKDGQRDILFSLNRDSRCCCRNLGFCLQGIAGIGSGERLGRPEESRLLRAYFSLCCLLPPPFFRVPLSLPGYWFARFLKPLTLSSNVYARLSLSDNIVVVPVCPALARVPYGYPFGERNLIIHHRDGYHEILVV